MTYIALDSWRSAGSAAIYVKAIVNARGKQHIVGFYVPESIVDVNEKDRTYIGMPWFLLKKKLGEINPSKWGIGLQNDAKSKRQLSFQVIERASEIEEADIAMLEEAIK